MTNKEVNDGLTEEQRDKVFAICYKDINRYALGEISEEQITRKLKKVEAEVLNKS